MKEYFTAHWKKTSLVIDQISHSKPARRITDNFWVQAATFLMRCMCLVLIVILNESLRLVAFAGALLVPPIAWVVIGICILWHQSVTHPSV